MSYCKPLFPSLVLLLFTSIYFTTARGGEILRTRQQQCGPDLLAQCNSSTICFTGVNLPRLSYTNNPDGTGNWQGKWPPISDYELYRSLGLNTIRYAFSWHHMQPNLNQNYVKSYFDILVANVTRIAKESPAVIVDSHNFGQYGNNSYIGDTLGGASATQYGRMWADVARNLSAYPNILFGIMNEPTLFQDTQKLILTLQTAIDAIRKANATTQYILVPAKEWQGMSTWLKYADSTLSLTDQSNRLIYDIHSYFDEAGGTKECSPFSKYQPIYQQVTDRLRKENKKAFLSEIGGMPSTQCIETVNDALTFLEQNADVWIGWTAWGAELTQPSSKGARDNSGQNTTFWIDCTPTDIVHNVFMKHAVGPKNILAGTSCIPLADSEARNTTKWPPTIKGLNLTVDPISTPFSCASSSSSSSSSSPSPTLAPDSTSTSSTDSYKITYLSPSTTSSLTGSPASTSSSTSSAALSPKLVYSILLLCGSIALSLLLST